MENEPHRRKLRRFNQPGHARFLTFSCYQRIPLLNHDGIRELFLRCLASTCVDVRVLLLAWVLMPEHAHLLVYPQGDPDMGTFEHALKRPFAEAVIRRWKELNAPILRRIAHGNGHRFWQTGGGYDRNLVSAGAIRQKIQYIHDNPVRRGLTTVATDYAWSSAQFYAGQPDAKLPCDPIPW